MTDQLYRIEQQLAEVLELLQPKKAVRKERPALHFEAWWKAYPKGRKVAKQKCLAIWKRKNLDEHARMLCTDVRNRIANCSKWKNGFEPSTTTYLSQSRWLDDMDTKPVVIVVPRNENELIAFAKERSLEPRVGELMHEFRARVERAV